MSDPAPVARVSGAVKFFKDRPGYGFIVCSDGTEVFFHRTDLKTLGLRDLNPGDHVTFEVVDGRNGKGKKAAAILLEKFAGE